MLIKKSISAPILATLASLSPEISFATEDSITSAFPVWPFFAIILVIIIFRKQLNCVPPAQLNEEPAPPVIQEKITTPTTTPEPAPEAKPEVIAPKVEAPDATPPEVKETIIDLKDNSQQCQASTAKGTRCKRKTRLEETSISLDNKTYLLTVCGQHNNDHLKPFPELIK